jgi:NitT/TauT family transport system ATP-binding protein
VETVGGAAVKQKIRFDGVTREFHTRLQTIVAVKDYSMEITEGEFVSILGASGCGKSTLIRMLDGIIAPSAGNIYIDGEPVNGRGGMPPALRRKVGFIFQQPNLLPWYSVRENVALPLRILGLKGKEWEDRVDTLLAMVGLEKYADASPAEISGGMLQRVGVIRALVHNPEILLMDEPFGALDELYREQLDMELLQIWQKTGQTIIFITHNIEEAVLMSSRIFVMGTHPGRLVDTVDIGLPRPRSLDMITQDDFTGYCRRITGLIGKLDLSKIK